MVSQIIDSGGAASGRGGNIWFYAPGGIILGAGSVFDVGSLLLTANAVTLGQGNTLPDSADGISFRGAAGSTSQIAIEAGAQVNADVLAGSYVAIVAPRITQAGSVTVNGTAAYVAAEGADITVHDGLFDIGVTTGTSVTGTTADTAALVHSGTTTGPAAGGAAGDQATYLVAVPKNGMITMLVGGDLGYQAAASASVQNGVLVLAGNRNVTTAAGSAGTPIVSLSASGASGTANADLGGATVTSPLLGAAEGISVASGATLTTSGDVTLSASRAIGIADLDMQKAGVLNLRSDGILNLADLGGEQAKAITLSGEYLTTGDLHGAGDVVLGAAAGDLGLTAGRGGIFVGNLASDTGSITISSAGAIQTGSLAATAGNVSTTSHVGLLVADPLTDGNASISAGGDVSIVDGFSVSMYNLTAGGTVSIRNTGGALTSDSGNITLSAPHSGISIANIIASSGNISTNSDGELSLMNASAVSKPLGNVIAGGDITIVDGHDINPNKVGGVIHINELHAGGTATLTETGGPIEIDGVMSAGTAITASSLGSLTVNGASVGANDGTLALTVAALGGKPGRLDISRGTNSAAHVVLSSGDIQTKSGALVGGSATQSIVFNNNGGVQTIVGDSSGSVRGAAVYQLDGAELARTEAGSITVNAPIVSASSGQPDLIVGGFTLAGGNGLPSGTPQNLAGTSGSLTIGTPGAMLVNGAVALDYLGGGNSLTLNAGQRLLGLLPDASVALEDGSGNLASGLTLTAPTITFASASAMGDIGSASSLADISARLATAPAARSRSRAAPSPPMPR